MKKILLSITAGLFASLSLFAQNEVIIGNCEKGNLTQLGTYWYFYSAGMSSISQTPKGKFQMTKGGANGTDSAAIVSGTLVNVGGTITTPGTNPVTGDAAVTYESAGIGIPLSNDSLATVAQTKNADSLLKCKALDLTAATGISFWHMGAALNFSVMVTDVLANKGQDHSFSVPATTVWTLVTVPFTSLAQPSWATQVAFDATKAYKLQWQVKDVAGDYNFGIDQVTLMGTTAVTSITVDKPTSTITATGGTTQITASVLPTTATYKNVTYTVSDPTIAAVSATGVVSALADGTVTLTATAFGGLTTTSAITISGQIRPTSITVSVLPTTAIITAALGTLQVTPTILPVNANQAISYTVSDNKVASVDANGLVTAKGNGTVTVTATSTGSTVSGTSPVITISGQVVPVTSVIFANPTATISVNGATLQVTATVLPTTATNQAVTYKITPISLATISATGLVTPKGDGSVTVTATSVADGTITAVCSITITNQITSAVDIIAPKAIGQIGNVFTFDGSAKLINILGQVVATGFNTIDANAIAPGIYFIVVDGYTKEVSVR